jgi:hypothetical protein
MYEMIKVSETGTELKSYSEDISYSKYWFIYHLDSSGSG